MACCSSTDTPALVKDVEGVSEEDEMVDDSGEDEHDAEIARARAREIRRDPKQLVRGKALEDELARLES